MNARLGEHAQAGNQREHVGRKPSIVVKMRVLDWLRLCYRLTACDLRLSGRAILRNSLE